MWSHTLDSAGLRVALCDSTFDCDADFTVSAYASRDADLDEADSPAVCFAAAFLTSDAATVAKVTPVSLDAPEAKKIKANHPGFTDKK